MSGPQVYLTWPNAFTPFPKALPPTLPPPVKERTFRSPFGIEKNLFNAVLEPWIPFTFAAVYIVTIFSLNAYNRSRDNKPWWIAKQKPFQWFVVVHNILLAFYSFATFAAMFRAIVHTWPGIRDNPNGLAGVADALCKVHGPRGLGDATTFNTTINIWETKNSLIKMGYDGNPDPTDVGRLWNEGLAFWGWMFYISKFYEVLDTLIILAKGKRSATLQTYHHAGAMLCMWAGIRYMSPPIWMFVFINSAIHGMMYTYFALSALGYRVPQGLKRTLTSMQIAQFVFGASYAAAHLFVAYDIPVSTPYQVASVIERAASSISSAAAEASTTISSVVATPTARALAPLIKKFLLRAAGEEGMAERVRDERHQYITPHIEEKIEHFNEQTYETRWRTEYTKVNCIDTSGEAFAIYLNLLYLAPLTFLFGRFFVKAYTQRGKPRTASQAGKQTIDSSKQAEEETERYIEKSGKEIEDEIAKRGPDAAEQIRQKTADVHDQLRRDVEEMKQGKFKGSRRVSDRVASFEKQTKSAVNKAKEQINDAMSSTRSKTNGSGSGTPKQDDAIEEDEAEEQQDDQAGEGAEEEQEQAKDNVSGQSAGQSEGAGEKDMEEKDDNKENQPPTSASREEPKQDDDKKDQTSASGSSEKSKQDDDKKSQPSASTPSAKPEQDDSKTNDNKDQSSSTAPKSESQRKQGSSPRKLARNDKSQNDKASQDQKQSGIPRAASPSKSDRKASPSKSDIKPTDPKSNAKQEQPSSQESKNGKDSQAGKQSGRPQSSQSGKPDSKSSDQKSNDKPAQGAGNKDKQSKPDQKQGNSKPAKAGAEGDKSGKAESQNESEEQQDANMADSQAVRPGDTVEKSEQPKGKDDSKAQSGDQSGDKKDEGNDKKEDDDDNDTDAMGKSGSIIDIAQEKAKEAQTEAKEARHEEEEDPAKGAEPSGEQWKSPNDGDKDS
ncbi:hypothetical protein LTR78_009089 [Recurvomyces mirabilis]|uniref:Elongation of fatty acids protein n=1 Tax=Recurvomyces mirabilis TaxID=574656 RepID=A0AAE0WIR6_9PEZI|nr:hypothetical protein LTR78_009089 [Recurvomyces mirabilis]